MEFLTALWAPILLSAVLVFIASSVIHMVLGYHKNDFKKLPNEDGVMEALRKFSIPVGDYHMPHCAGPKEMKSPEFLEKFNKGPVALITVFPTGQMNMTKSLILWFVFNLMVSVFAAYLAYHGAGEMPHYLRVFRLTGCAAFMGYALGTFPNSIWHGRSWSGTFLLMLDGLIYALVTAGTFGWLWPR